MSFLTRISLRNRLLVALITVAVAIAGVVTAGMLRQELLPSMTQPSTYVVVTSPGTSPDAMAEGVARPLETALRSVDGVRTVTTTSSSGMLTAVVEWPFGRDGDELRSAVRAAVDSARSALPADALVEVLSTSIDDAPVVQVAVSAPDGADRLAPRLESIAVPALSRVAGVEKVTLEGRVAQRVTIVLRPADLEARGVVAATLPDVLRASDVMVAAGSSVADGRLLSVEVGSPPADVAALADLAVPAKDGSVPLSAVADVREEPVPQTTIARVNGDTALVLSVTKKGDANVVSVSHGVRDALEAMQAELGAGTTLTTVFDQAPFIESSIHDLTVEGGLGLLFAVLVILVFLGSFRSTIVAAVSIPLSLLVSLIALFVGGMTLNVFTLGALTIAIGRVVDDSIVVIENIRRRQGIAPLTVDGVVASVAQVSGPISASTLTTIAVFLPIAFVSGAAGQLFRPFALTVSIALAASLVVALTIVPMLAYWFLRRAPRPLSAERLAGITARQERWAARTAERQERRLLREQERLDAVDAKRAERGLPPRAPRPRFDVPVAATASGEAATAYDRMQRAFLPVLGAAVRRPGRTIALSVVLLLITLAVAGGLRIDLLGGAGEKTLAVELRMPRGTVLAAADAEAARMEAVLAETPGVVTSTTNVRENVGADEANVAITVTLDATADLDATQRDLRERLGGGSALTVDSTGGAGLGGAIQIAVQGEDPAALAEAARAVRAEAERIPGAAQVTDDVAADEPVLRVAVDHPAAARLGFTSASIGEAVRSALQGQRLGALRVAEQERDIVLFSRPAGSSPADIAALPLPVTPEQQQRAVEEAQKKVTALADAQTEAARAASERQMDEQWSALRKARSEAIGQLATLREQLAAAEAAPIVPTAPVDPETIAVAERAAQIQALRQGIAQVGDGLAKLDEQLDQLAEGRATASEQQAQTETLTRAQRDLERVKAAAVQVRDVATVEERTVPATITRKDGVRQVSVSVTPEEERLGEVSAGVAELTERVALPSGTSFAISGASVEQQSSFRELGLAMLAAIVLVFLVMVATFRGLAQPLVLLVSVPFAATGAVILLAVTGTPLGLPALIGFLMLIGIVVTNAIVLIDLVNRLREDGMPLRDAIAHGARIRLRPILMTAAATVFALLPMLLGITGGGVFISRPLAVVVIGGLVSSTLLTLVLVPTLYLMVESRKERRAARRAAGSEVEAGAEPEPAG